MAKLTFPTSYLDPGGPLEARANEAKRKHATGGYSGTNTWYFIDNVYLSPAEANGLMQLPNVAITDYVLKRFIAVTDLDTDMPTSFPTSSTMDDEDNVRQLTWQEVYDMPTTPKREVEGIYYFDCTSYIAHRGLTLDEYNAIVADGVTLIEAKDIPNIVEETE